MAESKKNLEKHYARVWKGLTRAFEDEQTEDKTFDLAREPLVVLSDHHRGAKDGADDFWRCERAYHAALGYYLETGYRLVLLGDVDELWENHPEPVLEKYARTIRLEKEFYDAGRLERFWGNHDDLWRNEGQVEKHLGAMFPRLRIREALRAQVNVGDERLGVIFFVHGHQGTLDSERFQAFSRLAVRFGWRRIQRRWKIPSTTPARDFKLRATHDSAMFDWAKNRPERLVLIAGHTHKPVFSAREPTVERLADDVDRELQRLRTENRSPAELAALRAELELLRTEPFDEEPKEMPLPCYFNTGCCSFGDGDVTAIEIDEQSFRLVRWLNDDFEPKLKRLACRDLREVFQTVSTSTAA